MKMSSEYMADLHMFLMNYEGDLLTLKKRAIEHLKYIPRKKLYRYRKFNEREINTLQHNRIWISSPSCFPDLFDSRIPIPDKYYIDFWYTCYFTFELVYTAASNHVGEGEKLPDKEEFLDEVLTIMESYSPEEMAERARTRLGDNLYNSIKEDNTTEKLIKPRLEVVSSFLKELSTAPRHTLAITSFSSKIDNRNMWENYAENYTGFCVEYDFSKVLTATSEKNALDILHLLPVRYYAKLPTYDPKDFLRRMVQAEIQLSGLSFGDDFLQQYYRSITAKGYDYRAENEWRLIMNGTYVGEYLFPYVTGIFVGKDMCKENELAMLKVADELSVPLFKQTISVDKCTYTYVPVN